MNSDERNLSLQSIASLLIEPIAQERGSGRPQVGLSVATPLLNSKTGLSLIQEFL